MNFQASGNSKEMDWTLHWVKDVYKNERNTPFLLLTQGDAFNTNNVTPTDSNFIKLKENTFLGMP